MNLYPLQVKGVMGSKPLRPAGVGGQGGPNNRVKQKLALHTRLLVLLRMSSIVSVEKQLSSHNQTSHCLILKIHFLFQVRLNKKFAYCENIWAARELSIECNLLRCGMSKTSAKKVIILLQRNKGHATNRDFPNRTQPFFDHLKIPSMSHWGKTKFLVQKFKR